MLNIKKLSTKVLNRLKLINTTDSRWAKLTVTSHDQSCSLIIEPLTPTAATPAVELTISASGSITIYSNSGNGWAYKRTI